MLTNVKWIKLSEAIQQKLKQLKSARALIQWQERIVPTNEKKSKADNNKDWGTISIPYTWSSADGEAWFQTAPVLPSEIEGIKLAGSNLELDVILAIGATVYFNGKEIYKESFWSDTRSMVLKLLNDYQPGTPINIEVRANAYDGFGIFLEAELHFSHLEDVIFDLDLLLSEMAFTGYLAESSKDSSPALSTSWEKAANLLHLDALTANDWQKWNSSVNDARKALTAFTKIAKSYTTHMVAHSHIDMNWLWPWRETLEVCRRDFSTMNDLMKKYPEFVFSQSQAATYRAVELEYPKLFAEMKKRISEKKWDVTASTWVEGDLNMAAGETIVRHIIQTRKYIQEKFGVTPTICWEPDTFGHPATLPQILKKSGIKYYYFCRAGKMHPLFWWEALDGSKVLAVQDMRGYGGPTMPMRIIDGILDFSSRYEMPRGLYVYGVGDHGGGATAVDIQNMRKMDADPLLPKTVPNSTISFYDAAAKEAKNIPVVRDELNTVFEGCYTSHANIKKLNRNAENLLLTTESINALTTLTTDSPKNDLAEAWRTVCFHQFHDILCGCAISVTYREAEEKITAALKPVSEGLSRSLDALAAAVVTRGGKGKQIIVFNPHAWECTNVVHIPLEKLQDWKAKTIVDDRGIVLPIQKTKGEWIFVAENLPAFGVRVYQSSKEPCSDSMYIKANPETFYLENNLLRIHVNPHSGALDMFLDKSSGRNYCNPGNSSGPEALINSGMLNRLQILWEEPHTMSAWNLGDTTRVDNLIQKAKVRVIESGPVCGVVEVKHKFLHSSLVQRICVYCGFDRVDFETEVDWHEKGNSKDDAPMLRVTFTPSLERTRATFEIPYAGLERVPNGSEVPALRWIDISEENNNCGLSLLNNCKYGHQVQGNTMGLTLVRASYEPDINPDEGLHKFTYSLYPHSGSWKEAGTIKRATELNQPFQYAISKPHPGDLVPGQSWLSCESKSAFVSSVKLAEEQPANEKAVIIRLYETYGEKTDAVIRSAWSLKHAVETDLLENKIKDISVDKGNQVRVTLDPYEIKTIEFFV